VQELAARNHLGAVLEGTGCTVEEGNLRLLPTVRRTLPEVDARYTWSFGGGMEKWTRLGWGVCPREGGLAEWGECWSLH
jgi:hypothetical protein